MHLVVGGTLPPGVRDARRTIAETRAGRYGFARLETALVASRGLHLDPALAPLVEEVKWWAGGRHHTVMT